MAADRIRIVRRLEMSIRMRGEIGRPYNSAVKVGRSQTVELPRVWPGWLRPPRTFHYYHYLLGLVAGYIRAITFPLLGSCAWHTNDCFCLPKGYRHSAELARPFAFNYPMAGWKFSFQIDREQGAALSRALRPLSWDLLDVQRLNSTVNFYKYK